MRVVAARKTTGSDMPKRATYDDPEGQPLLDEQGPSFSPPSATPAAQLSPSLERSTNILDVFVPALFYVSTSASLILLNKYALAAFGFTCPNSLVLFHCVLAVVLVKVAEVLGYVHIEPLTWPIVKLWFPVNLIFVGMVREQGRSHYPAVTLGSVHASAMQATQHGMFGSHVSHFPYAARLARKFTCRAPSS